VFKGMKPEQKSQIQKEISDIVGENIQELKKKDLINFLKGNPKLEKYYNDKGKDGILEKLFEKFGKIKLRMLEMWVYSTKHLIELNEFLNENFSEFEILEKINLFVRIKLNSKFKLSEIFGKLNTNQERLNIEEYNVKPMSLEQIFLTFADQKK
jgi:hypothetical protein